MNNRPSPQLAALIAENEPLTRSSGKAHQLHAAWPHRGNALGHMLRRSSSGADGVAMTGSLMIFYGNDANLGEP